MKDFAKSIRTGNEYKPGTYDPRRHEINIMKIDYEISKWRQVISGEKQRIASLERMVSSGDYGKMTAQELKEAKRNLEAAYMRLDQALSMKKRATGNSKVGNSKPGSLFTYVEKANIAKQRYQEAKSRKDYPEGAEYQKKLAKEAIKDLTEIISRRKDSIYDLDEEDISDAKKAIEIYKQIGNSVPENLHERFGYRLAVTKDGEGKKQTISELEMSISDYKNEIAEKEKELNKDKQNLQKLEAVLRKYK